jgi:GNAT superfamily N-acetyltransferase
MNGFERPILRELAIDDAADVAALIRLAFSQTAVRADPAPSALRETAEGVAAVILAGGGLAAWSDGALVAAVLWAEKDGGLYVSRLSVAPEARGRGLARGLLAAAEEEARRRGLPRVHLATRLVFLDNRRLFASCGFVETELHAHPGYDAPTFVDMEKIL